MSFADQPAPHGATKIDHRAGENQPYVYQPYPGFRYHPDLGAQLVRNEEQDKVLGPPWRDTPYPPKPVVAPVPEPTMAELKAENTRLAGANNILTLERDAFERENLDMKAYIAEQTNQQTEKGNKKSGKQPKTEAAA